VRSLRVLVLEDNDFQLMSLHMMLNTIQVFHVQAASSVEAAQQALAKRGDVDIVICDLHMDGPDGFDMIRYLAESDLARALIILSVNDQSVLDGAAHLARSQGHWVLGSIQKPMSVVVLYELLQSYLDHIQSEIGLLPLVPRCSLDERHRSALGQCIGDAGTCEHVDRIFSEKS
jgi:CheY-like chemotaxis protein